MTYVERNNNNWRLRNTFPSLRAAGKLIPIGDMAKTCLEEISPRPVTPEIVRKFHNTTRPRLGVTRVFYSKAADPDIASTLVHGVNTKASITAGSVINPTPKGSFQQRLCQLQEAVYATNQKAPLGRSQEKGPGLPHWLDAENATFGVKSVRSANAGEMINPSQTMEQVDREGQEGHQQYVRSHNAYSVGERVDRKYNSSQYMKNTRFGVPTPHHNDGRNVSKSLKWQCDTQKHHSAKFVLKRYDDFRERTQPQIGKVHDPIAETLNVPVNHTFGVLIRPDTFGVRDLLYSTPPTEYMRGTDRQRTLVRAVRQQLKEANFHSFSSLLHAFKHYDKKGQGKIDKDDLLDVCRQFNLDISDSMLDILMNHCNIDKDGHIDFLEFANFLNWKDKMPINKQEQRILTAGRKASTAPTSMPSVDPQAQCLVRTEDLEPTLSGGTLKTPKTLPHPRALPDRFVTSSSIIRAVVGRLPIASDPVSGVPTVRSDLAAPRVKRIGDRTNYGDHATAYDLLYPPLHSAWGVHEEHFFSPRTKEEIQKIFQNVGISITDDTFEQAWKLAAITHPTGEVCVESFRNVLKELQAK